MTPRGLLKIAAIALGVALALLLLTDTGDAQQPEGAMGYDADMPRIVKMTGPDCQPGYVIGRGTLTAAEHEIVDGSFSLSHGGAPVLSVVMPSRAVALLRARELAGRDVEIIVREIQPRELQTVTR